MSTLNDASPVPPHKHGSEPHQNLGQLLVQMGKLSPEQVETVLRQQRQLDCTFGEAAVTLGLVRRADIMEALSRQYRYPILQGGSDTGRLSRELVIGHDPFGPAAEAIRSIRSAFVQAALGKGIKSVVIIGPHRDVGSTYLAGNLALSLAQMGLSTLLVETDMRSSRVGPMFGLHGRGPGLAEALRGRHEDPSSLATEVVANLFVLPAGAQPPNPQELLSSAEFLALTTSVEERYNAVIYDSAPGIEFADAQIVAARVGAALVVARQHVSSFDDLSQVVAKIENTGCNLLGTVFNRF